MGDHLSLPDRRSSTVVPDDVEDFIVALAHEVPDAMWYDIGDVWNDCGTLTFEFDDPDQPPNAIGNRYVRGLLSHGYALTGYSNHYDDSDEHIDRVHFRQIEHDDDTFTSVQTEISFGTSPQRRLAEIGLEPDRT